MNGNKSSTMLMIIALLALVLVIGYAVMNAPDRRSPGEKLGDAVSNIGDGLDKAGESLQDRTPAQKLGDAVENAGDDVERALD